MKCYLINLDRSADRLERAHRIFSAHGLTYSRVEAVDGKLLSQAELDAITLPLLTRNAPILASEVGCFLSHRNCLELIANGPDEYAAVFEDDVVLSDDAKLLLGNLGWIPSDADFIKIDTFRKVVLLESCVKIKGTNREVGRLLSEHLCTGAYIISRSAAKKALVFMEQFSAPVDCLFFSPRYEMFSNFTIYQVYPALCKQDGFDSLIGHDRKTRQLQFQHRPSVPQKIVREIFRPYGRYSHILSLSKLWTRLISQKKWVRVNFK